MKRLVTIILALMLIMSSTAFAEEIPNIIYMDYHDFTQFPLEADDNVEIDIIVRGSTDSIPIDDTWFWPWLKSIVGVKLNIEMVPYSSGEEKLNLYFASGDLPDVLMNFGVGTADGSGAKGIGSDKLTLYGQEEGMLLPLNDYMYNPDIMPNCSTFMTKILPEAASFLTCNDGNIYTLGFHPWMRDGETTRTFIDQNLLDAVGRGLPTTLDDFIDLMYTFQQYDPSLTPLGGNQMDFDITYYILNAMGFLGAGYNDGTGVTVRNGEVVIPAADPLFKECLQIMKKFYDDEIITKDYFTMDQTTLNAMMAEGKLGVYPYVPFVVNAQYDFFSHWSSVEPLTSQWNDKRQWLAPVSTGIGGFVVSANTEHAELIMRIADAFYAPEMITLEWMGPQYGSAYSADYSDQKMGWYIDSEYNTHRVDRTGTEVTTSTGQWGGMVGGSMLGYGFGSYYRALDGSGLSGKQVQYYYSGQEPIDYYNPMQGDPNFRQSMIEHISPYHTEGYPNVVYMDIEDTYRMDELSSVLKPYMKTEIAKFITGSRNLDEFDAYLAELESMGIREYEQFYKTNYSNFLASKEG